MGRLSIVRTLLLAAAAATVVAVVRGQEDYLTRQRQLRNIGLQHPTSQHTPVVQGFLGLAVLESEVDELLLDIENDRDAAFKIVVLVRILMFSADSDPALRDRILNSLRTLPFWLTDGEGTRVYWTENQQSMWMSSAWLLREHFGLSMGPTLEQRLRRYLGTKKTHGYSEFFSSVYFPYTLSGLVNLADFASDPEIRNLAVDATNKLLSTILLVANDKGKFFAAAGRNYNDFYLNDDKGIQGTVWLLTGLGDEPTYLHHGTSFLATSDFDVSSVVGSYDPNGELEASIDIGPSLEKTFAINSDLTRLDRIMFQWSIGCYFHPDCADDTQWLLDELNLWGHGEFADFTAFEGLPSWIGNAGSSLLSSITRSSVITGRSVDVYRNREVVLSSVQNFNPGRLGWQIFPIVATTGTETVWMQSGKVEPNWNDRPDSPSQAHLPYIEQSRNVALVMYDAKEDLDRLGTFAPDSPMSVDDYEVSVRWPTIDDPAAFDEVREVGMWLVGRESDGYVAVARHCLDRIYDIPTCSDERQVWAMAVGNAGMYGTFDIFVEKVGQASVSWSYGWSWSDRVFDGEVVFDGITISHQWRKKLWSF